MRRSAIVITAAIVLALVGGGIAAANVLTVRDEPGVAQSVEPVIAVPDPALTPPPESSVAPPSSPAPVPPAPPEDLDDDDDDIDDDDDDDNN